jgi:mannosyl-oligosaccharide alpha-1,2-mannosidase
MSKKFLKAASENFFFRPMLPNEDDILISGAVNAPHDANEPPVLDPESEHLACFIGGTVALGGRLLNQEWNVQTGARLAKGCAYVYKSFPTGIGPERWNMIPCTPVRATECKWNETLWDQEKVKQPRYLEHLPKGFTTAKDPRYLLRPEAIESLFVLYRMTGEIWYQDMAWDMFKSIAKGTATPFANAAVLDVTVDLEHLPQEDYMEVSFGKRQSRCIVDLFPSA